MGDSVVKDRRIGRQARDRELVDIACQRAAIEELPRNIVEPNALPQIMQHFSSFHGYTSKTLFTIKFSCRFV